MWKLKAKTTHGRELVDTPVNGLRKLRMDCTARKTSVNVIEYIPLRLLQGTRKANEGCETVDSSST